MAEFLATDLFVFIGAGTVVIVTGVLQRSPLNDPAAPVAIGLAVLAESLIGVPLIGAGLSYTFLLPRRASLRMWREGGCSFRKHLSVRFWNCERTRMETESLSLFPATR